MFVVIEPNTGQKIFAFLHFGFNSFAFRLMFVVLS